MLMQEQEDQADASIVRLEDQERINEFGRLNMRLAELQREKKALQEKLDTLEDAGAELMMGEGDDVYVMMGESFVETSEESAQEYLETLTEAAKKDVQVLVEEEEKLDNRQTILKKILYSRFGDTINLEEK
ncbi:hypothetical protein ABG067_001634 [Albugo candida]|uniref:Prefoldin subunit 4 n=1 Tax=Albugo candida TaxID=65357 RepID=A0A024GCX5_9STRA|nr:unnamed protein product [Albugo candida]|eukprot:CCI44367.1 unnamed protein product [Albugo candida]